MGTSALGRSCTAGILPAVWPPTSEFKMITKEQAKTGTLVEIEKDGKHENGVIISAPSETSWLARVLLLSGQVVVRHVDRISLRTP